MTFHVPDDQPIISQIVLSLREGRMPEYNKTRVYQYKRFSRTENEAVID